jgi:hypothetical protein
MRTLLVRGFGVGYRNSRPQNGDRLTPPSAFEVLHDVLSNSIGVDNADGELETWAEEYGDTSEGFAGGLRAFEQYKQTKRDRNDMAAFLDDYYEEFKDAAMNE